MIPPTSRCKIEAFLVAARREALRRQPSTEGNLQVALKSLSQFSSIGAVVAISILSFEACGADAQKPLALMPSKALAPNVRPGFSCSPGWKVTGYHVPVQTDSQPPLQTILVKGHGSATFPASFLPKVDMEGWAQTSDGWFLGHENGEYFRSDFPLNAHGKALRVGHSMAAALGILKQGTLVQLPDAPSPWNSYVFTIDDVGDPKVIAGQHVDVFTGTGEAAHANTFKIDNTSERLCFKRL